MDPLAMVPPTLLSVLPPLQLAHHLIEVEGFRASYRRIPLSRERTPEAEDLEQLHGQVG